MNKENGFEFIKAREEFQSEHSTQANDVRDGPRVLSDRAGKPFMTRMLMRFQCMTNGDMR
ncbi:hypothetical protein BZG13_13915 [Salinivibrio sp. ML323]|nr:hypothetical protein BZG13_13915 [Salinivibrio sp. ML323]